MAFYFIFVYSAKLNLFNLSANLEYSVTGTNLEKNLGGGGDKGINKQSVWRVNLTKVTIIDQIDKFVPKKE